MKVALLGEAGKVNRPYLEEALATDWQIEHWMPGEPEADAEKLLNEASAVVISPDALMSGRTFELIQKSKSIQIFQVPFAGTDWLRPDGVPETMMVCNAIGHEEPMAEFVIGAMLEWEIGFRRLDDSFRGGSWKFQGISRAGDSKHGEIFGKTLGLFGYGQIGQETAKRAAGFGMRTIALARSPRTETPAPLDWIGTPADFDRFLEESDYIALVCDLNKDTRHIFDATAFEKMRPHAMIVNVARGPVIEEEALYTALKTKQIAGAAIDTWYIYPGRPLPGMAPEESPRPSRFPFHELDNLIMTPHCSAHTEQADQRRWHSVAANLDALARGERPPHFVMQGKGRF